MTNKIIEKRAFSIAESAEYACISRGTLEHWLAEGLLPYEELPGRGSKQRFRRIRKKDLDAFLDQNIKVNNATHHKNDTGEQKGIFLLPKST